MRLEEQASDSIMDPITTFIILYLLTAAYGFLDGLHGSANLIATVVSSRAMSMRRARYMAATAEFAGPFLFGSAVAKTIGEHLLEPNAVTVSVVASAVAAAIIWKSMTWWIGLPSSASHSLFGGLIGAVILGSGFEALKLEGLQTIILFLLVTPVFGLVGGYLVMALTLVLTRGASPSINDYFKKGQSLTVAALALANGSNSGQRLMGIMALGLVSTGLADSFQTPVWMIASAAGAITLGTLLSGTRLLRTVGAKFYRIRPVDGFTAQATTAGIIIGASLLGGPVSTTEVVSSTIVGVGAAERRNKVRWQVFQEIALAWLVTLPATAILAALLYLPLQSLL